MSHEKSPTSWLSWKDININADLYHNILDRHAPRLFTKDTDKAEVWHLGQKLDCIISHESSSIIDAIQPSGEDIKETFCIIRQKHSWSELGITKETFQKILKVCRILPQFIGLIRAFGVKFSEDQQAYIRCLMPMLHFDGIQGSPEYEICYNIQYIAKRGLSSDAPWCVRQMCLYQQVKLRSLRSFCMLIQPPDTVLGALRAILQAQCQFDTCSRVHPLTSHDALLEVLLDDWEEYIETLRAEIIEIDDKACFSKMGIRPQYDYVVTFKDTQKLQLIRQRLFRAQFVLDSQRMVAEKCQTLTDHLAELGHSNPYSHSVSSNFAAYISRIQIHHDNIQRLIEYSRGTMDVLSKMLEFRTDEVLLQTNQTVNDNLETLSSLGIQGGKIAEQAYEDSKLLKALNIIAIVYLPASLVATIFSSNLVDTQSNGSQVQEHLVVAKEFWIYVLVTVALTLLTFTCSFSLRKYWMKP